MRSILAPVTFLGCIFSLICGNLLGYVSVGSEAPAFTAIDIDGKEHSLAEYKDKVIVLEWTNPKCPYCTKQYSKAICNGIGNIQSMQQKFMVPPHNVIWLTIASITKGEEGYYTAEEWKAFLQKTGATPTAILMDDLCDLAKTYSVRRTPEVFVIGRDGLITYRGAIDSMRGTNPLEIEQFANIHWLHNAIEKTLKRGVIAPSETIPYGCPVPY
jgi:peroxiredoxin